jgi:ribosomal protein S18 acetylase RimI-like enzyme
MEFTLVKDSNFSAFEDLLFDDTDRSRKDILRIGAVEQGVAVGALSAGFGDGTCNIRSIYTTPGHRRRGAARGMLHKLKSILNASPYDVLKCEFPSDADGVEPLLESEGFLIRQGGEYYETDLNTVLDSSFIARNIQLNTLTFKYFRFDQLHNTEKNEIITLLEEKGYGERFTDIKRFDHRFSSAVYDSEHVPYQCLLVTSNPECIFVNLIVSLQKTPNFSSVVLLAQIKGFLETLKALHESDNTASVIRFEAENRSLMFALAKIVGKDIFHKVCTGMSAVTFIV